MPHPTTSKLGLLMPNEGSFGWHGSWYHNFNTIDNHPGVKVCTSETMPESPWTGQLIYVSDTEFLMIYARDEWRQLWHPDM